jgi:hypothetical protein
MNAANDNSAAKRLRRWWLTPPRSGLQRFIHPWEYRNLRRFAAIRIVGGCVAAFAGFMCLAYAAFGWAAFFLVIAALEAASAWWYLAILHSASARS